MIEIIRRLREKYKKIAKHSEYISIAEVEVDLYNLEQEVRIQRLPKSER